MFRRTFSNSIFALAWLLVPFTAQAAAEDLSKGKGLGIGVQATAPFVPPDAFPASGLSLRLWIGDLVGLELDTFLLSGSPSFSPRVLAKFFNAEIVDLYLGLGLSTFTYTAQGKTLLYAPLQGLAGLEIRLSKHLALNAELGLFGHSGQAKGVTAGLGVHFYF